MGDAGIGTRYCESARSVSNLINKHGSGMKREFDESSASAEELWDYCMREYNSRNFLVEKLLANFYRSVAHALPELRQGERVLEVGCGAGESTRRLVTSIPGHVRYEASEYDPRYVEILSQRGFPVPVRQESVYQLDRDNDSFDLVIMLEVLEHLENVELALSELFRVSSRYLLLSVPNEPLWRALNFLRGRYWRSFGNTPGHLNHWSPSSFRALLSRYGSVKLISKPIPWIIALVQK